ncbi:hypothetical protein JCM24511_03680 [Saitozyma sp. JCM 24511]|nr:hypothetical protein JCM24511_03680 [Saitozyma sp. JCM 24511]
MAIIATLHRDMPVRTTRPTPELLALHRLARNENHRLAEKWLDGFGVGDIPRESVEVGYSRSSGPGGQHVNKTNSKATVRCDLSEAVGRWLPPFVLEPLSRSSHYRPAPPTLLISSQLSRSASSNLSTAMGLLHRTIQDAGRSVLVGETSVEQRQKVRGMMRAEEGRRRSDKERRGRKKADRRGD